MLVAPREGPKADLALGAGRPSRAARVSGEVVRGRVKTAMICSWLLACTACGAIAPANDASPRPSASLRPSAAVAAPAAPCAAVTVTTSIAQVSPACQQLWSSYWVTEVPPANELALEHVPPAPTVANMTNGAVSDQTAQHWADASNWDSGWWKWAQGHDQLFMLRFLVGPSMIPADEVDVLQNGGTVDQPDCNLYPLSWKLFPVDATARAYFARRRLQTTAAYAFVIVYSGPCSETLRSANGTTSTIVDFTQNTTVFQPGVLRKDPVLGDIWFADAGGTCQDPNGPPAAWCGR
jgi:hypothetical protein